MAKQRPAHVHVGQRQLKCPLCQNDVFAEREIKLNTSGMSLMNLDWANASARGFVCMECGRVEMFLDNGNIGLKEA